MTKRQSITLALVAAGVLALVAGIAWQRMNADDAASSATKPDGAALLGVALPDASGREQSLGQWNGKVLVVNFWATWCEPCREEMPRFVKLQQEYGEKGLQFVGIAIDEGDKVQRFASEIHLNYPTLLGGYGAIELSKTLGNRLGALPFTVIIDRAGGVVQTHLGPMKDAELRSIIRQLI